MKFLLLKNYLPFPYIYRSLFRFHFYFLPQNLKQIYFCECKNFLLNFHQKFSHNFELACLSPKLLKQDHFTNYLILGNHFNIIMGFRPMRSLTLYVHISKMDLIQVLCYSQKLKKIYRKSSLY